MGHVDLRNAWRHARITGLDEALATWRARCELNVYGLDLVPPRGEAEQYPSRAKDRADILDRHREWVLSLLRGASTCGEVADRLHDRREYDLATDVELWAVASVKRTHVVGRSAGEQGQLFELEPAPARRMVDPT
jgi:hypothetical protein